MNILASYNWIKEYLSTTLSPEEFARELSLKSMSVESIENLADKFFKMVVGVIKEINPHPKADRLRICVTDIGSEMVEIVCGGSNVAVGQKVLVALPGANVRWHGEGELIELKETEIRGVKSIGMICAAAEVGFEKIPAGEHEIWDLSTWTEAAAGTPIVQALQLDDTIFDIEVTTNRPDAMSILGLANEGAAATDGQFKMNPPPMIPDPTSSVPISVRVLDPDLCPRYMAVVIRDVKVGPSPAWLQTKLLLAGHRPINNVVDITNYLLHEMGQPLHAFDYETLAGHEIIVRRAHDGEKLVALDGNEYELSKNNLVIADAAKPVAVAGVMGGEETGTKNQTTTIVFEAAAFDPVSVRRTARALNLQSDSQLLFEKGLSVISPQWALAKAVQMALQLTGGQVASAVIDIQEKPYEWKKFTLRPERVRAQIGVEISDEQMIEILKSLGFMFDNAAKPLEVTVPFWRDHDIEDEIDLTEEIARIYGYHNLPSVLPSSPPPVEASDPALAWEGYVKSLLFSAGYTELYGYSFTSEDEMKRYNLDPENAVKIFNPLTSDLTHLRKSLMPSLLRDVESNQGEVGSGKVFELSRVYEPRAKDLPTERTHLIVAEFGVENVEKAFLDLKGVLVELCDRTGLSLQLDRIVADDRWHPTRTARVHLNGEPLGRLGQISPEIQMEFGVKKPVVALEIDLEAVIDVLHEVRRYQPIAEFPAVTRDLSIVLDDRTEYEDVVKIIRVQSELVEQVKLIDVYRGVGVEAGKKSVTVSLTLRAADRTLSSGEADEVLKLIGDRLVKDFSAIIR
jgi:phenylalanyl-tRNA synthetase beta chain